LARLERERFAAPRLSALSARITGGREPATAAVSHLRRLVERHDWQHNPFFAPFGLVLLWGTHLALALDVWRRAHGPRVAGWVDAVGEFEALSSLAAYAFEHPADPFPVILASPDGGRPPACFDAEALGHPLLPAASMVRNDVRLVGGTRLLLVSGSNMSGKSTLLRSVGINAVLAQMGAPVRAASLRLSPLRVGATLRIQDSLQEGRSRFYAEITRVRELADLARGEVPLLFLLDELFHGTNSHDRQAGAAGVLRSLIDRGAIGLVTTHDLALTSMAGALGAAAVNVHFEDVFEHGEIHFDFRLKPGPVTRSNALALMRAVGLEVEDQ
jgi:DNA mismatch repair ATPase MutS